AVCHVCLRADRRLAAASYPRESPRHGPPCGGFGVERREVLSVHHLHVGPRGPCLLLAFSSATASMVRMFHGWGPRHGSGSSTPRFGGREENAASPPPPWA